MMNNTISWNNITLGDYEQIQSIVTSDMEEVDKTVELLKIITHDENIDELPVAEFNKLVNKLSLLNMPIGRNKIKKKYVFNGVTYNCITDISKLTTGQFIDYTNICKEAITLENIKKIVAILLIPEGYKYGKDYDIVDVENAVENYMSITDVYGIADFFKDSLRAQLRHLLGCFRKATLMSPMKMKQKIQTALAIEKLRHQLEDLLSMD